MKVGQKLYQWIHIAFYESTYWGFRCFFKIFFRHQVWGRENVPLDGACILASNHTSFGDPPIVGISHSREMYYFARSTLMKNPFSKLLFQLWNCIPVDRKEPAPGSLKKALKVLKEGYPLLLFPEGTRSLDGKLQPGKMGIGFIAHKTKAPVIPFYIDGAYDILPKGTHWPRFKKLKVFIGKSLAFPDLYSQRGSEEIYQRISDEVMEAIKQLKMKSEELSV
ncbi:MAG: 1-acyl-sn-glycerol-3-phosphate acyltransferase [Chlamydiae bacterium]|nr:1-acyl-sn-glycerol-3-phosphate acyltransferase [Chlamydiota bacterium]MBI3277755.1 1-acyl-sn-glycerol-3-phosphate acyltransferase [Chlamydiota bacterium]